MTKERKLAIRMWLWIRDNYEEYVDYWKGSGDEDGFIEVMKDKFDDEYLAFPASERIIPPRVSIRSLWRGGCWLCKYCRDHRPKIRRPEDLDRCYRCPLKTCGEHSPYRILDCYAVRNKAHYQECCTQILRALGYKGE